MRRLRCSWFTSTLQPRQLATPIHSYQWRVSSHPLVTTAVPHSLRRFSSTNSATQTDTQTDQKENDEQEEESDWDWDSDDDDWRGDEFVDESGRKMYYDEHGRMRHTHDEKLVQPHQHPSNNRSLKDTLMQEYVSVKLAVLLIATITMMTCAYHYIVLPWRRHQLKSQSVHLYFGDLPNQQWNMLYDGDSESDNELWEKDKKLIEALTIIDNVQKNAGIE